jgi:hypothetical protein
MRCAGSVFNTILLTGALVVTVRVVIYASLLPRPHVVSRTLWPCHARKFPAIAPPGSLVAVGVGGSSVGVAVGEIAVPVGVGRTAVLVSGGTVGVGGTGSPAHTAAMQSIASAHPGSSKCSGQFHIVTPAVSLWHSAVHTSSTSSSVGV